MHRDLTAGTVHRVPRMAPGREILPLAPHSASSLVRRLSRLPVLPPARLAIVNPPITLAQRGVAEGTGTPLLLAAVVGSGLMGDVWVPNDITAPVAGACVGVFVAHAMFPS